MSRRSAEYLFDKTCTDEGSSPGQELIKIMVLLPRVNISSRPMQQFRNTPIAQTSHETVDPLLKHWRIIAMRYPWIPLKIAWCSAQSGNAHLKDRQSTLVKTCWGSHIFIFIFIYSDFIVCWGLALCHITCNGTTSSSSVAYDA